MVVVVAVCCFLILVVACCCCPCCWRWRSLRWCAFQTLYYEGLLFVKKMWTYQAKRSHPIGMLIDNVTVHYLGCIRLVSFYCCYVSYLFNLFTVRIDCQTPIHFVTEALNHGCQSETGYCLVGSKGLCYNEIWNLRMNGIELPCLNQKYFAILTIPPWPPCQQVRNKAFGCSTPTRPTSFSRPAGNLQ